MPYMRGIERIKMADEVFLSIQDGRLRIAQIDKGIVTHLDAVSMKTRNDDPQSLSGRIYLGRVERVLSRLQAAFVDIGEERSGFLGAREARILAEEPQADTPIEECLAEGDTVLVQVTRPPLREKGAQLTADVTLPGRAVVIAPCRNRVAISRAIEDAEIRQRLETDMQNILSGQHSVHIDVEGMDGPAGWVVRTAAAALTIDELARDMELVAAQWTSLLAQAQQAEPPKLLYRDLDPVQRALRDYIRPETRSVVIEGEAAFRVAQGFCKEHMPELLPMIRQSDADEYLFDRYDVESQLQAALNPRVNLPSGGWLMIETTEAMTTIDINSGSHDAEPREINLEAIPVLARQIRLRGLGGLIAIDFIDMAQEDAAADIEEALAQAFADDRLPVRLGAMSDFGVIEMTRRRPAHTLADAFSGRDE